MRFVFILNCGAELRDDMGSADRALTWFPWIQTPRLAGNTDIISPGCPANLARNHFPVCGNFLFNDKNESFYNIYV